MNLSLVDLVIARKGNRGWCPFTSLNSNSITNIPDLHPLPADSVSIAPSCLNATAVESGSWTDGTDGNNAANAGETISCAYKIDNAGTQTLRELCVIDDNVGNECIECGPAGDVDALPGAYFSCSTNYEVIMLTISATCFGKVDFNTHPTPPRMVLRSRLQTYVYEDA